MLRVGWVHGWKVEWVAGMCACVWMVSSCWMLGLCPGCWDYVLDVLNNKFDNEYVRFGLVTSTLTRQF